MVRERPGLRGGLLLLRKVNLQKPLKSLSGVDAGGGRTT